MAFTDGAPLMSIKQMPLPQSTFTPTLYKPEVPDISILQRSMAQREDRIANAAKQEAAFNSVAAQLETLVNPNEQKWVKDYIDRQSKQFKTSIDSGDYANAINEATVAGSNLLKNPEAVGRIRAQQSYTKEVETQQKRRDNKEISQNTYDWWMHNNPYKYKDTYDENGNIIGGTDYIAESRPVADINWASQAEIAFKLLSPYKNSVSKESSSQNGDHTNGTGTTTANSSGSRYEVQRIKKEDILRNIENLLGSTPDGYRQAEQAYDVSKYETEKMEKEYRDLLANDPTNTKVEELKQKLEKRHQLLYKNGSPIDYKEYYARMITDNAFAQGLAYDWRTSATSSSNTSMKETNTGTTTTTTNRQTSSMPFPGATFNYVSGMWEGPATTQTVETSAAQNGVIGAAGQITSSFE